MNTKVVVICKDQQEFVPDMLDVLVDHEVCYVFDRCEPNKLSNNYIVNEHGNGFLAGRMRDLGASFFDYNGPILFLDGDKIPNKQLPNFEDYGYDCVMMGTENDPRKLPEGIVPRIRKDFVHNKIYSCGIWLNQTAIDCTRSLCDGRIFHSAFDGEWGEEDRYLGDVLRHFDLTIGFTKDIILSGVISGLDDSKRFGFAMNFYKRLLLREKLNL